MWDDSITQFLLTIWKYLAWESHIAGLYRRAECPMVLIWTWIPDSQTIDQHHPIKIESGHKIYSTSTVWIGTHFPKIYLPLLWEILEKHLSCVGPILRCEGSSTFPKRTIAQDWLHTPAVTCRYLLRRALCLSCNLDVEGILTKCFCGRFADSEIFRDY